MPRTLRWTCTLLALASLAGCSCGEPDVTVEPPEELPGAGGGAGGGGGEVRIPPVANPGTDSVICAGGSVQLGDAPVTGLGYVWTPADGLSDATVANPVANPAATTQYTLTVTDTATDLFAVGQVTVTVNPLPTVVAGADVPLVLGSSTALSATASGGTAPYTYAWSSLGGSCDSAPCLVDGATATPTVSPSVDTQFNVAATDANGCVSAPDSSAVTVVPPLVANAGPARAMCAGDSVVVGAPASGGVPPYTYLWSASGTCAAPLCLSDVAVESPTVAPASTMTFTQTVTDSMSSMATSTAAVTVHPHPGVAGPDQIIGTGSAVSLGPVTPLSTATYAWTCNRADCALNSVSASNPIASPLRSTRYTLDASSGAGCTKTSTRTLWVLLSASSTPADGEAAWPVNSKLALTFSEPLLASSVSSSTVRLEEAASGNVVAATTSYDAATGRLVITPTGTSYAAGVDYTVVLAGGETGVRSADPVLAHIFANDHAIDFTTAAADNTPPAIASQTPAPGTNDVSPTTTILVRFNEAIDPTTVNGTSFTVSANGSPLAATVAFDPATNTATLTPAASLPDVTVFTIALTGIADYAGNTASFTSTFTTGNPDVTPPTVTAVNPADGATGVSGTPVITVTFSEQVLAATVSSGLTLKRVSDGATVSSAVTLNATSTVASLTPSQQLGSLEQYQVVVSGVKDLSQNAMAAPFTSTFTTRQRLFSDAFEGGSAAWTLGGAWAVTTASAASPVHSLTDSPAGKYAANQTTAAELAAPIALSNNASVSIRFAMRTRTEKAKDFLTVEYQLDGGAWTQLPGASFSGNNAWATRSFTLGTAGKSSLKLRFQLATNQNRNFDGVFIDDVLVEAP